MTVSGLLKNISSKELTEWMAYFQLRAEDSKKPFGSSKKPEKKSKPSDVIKAMFANRVKKKRN